MNLIRYFEEKRIQINIDPLFLLQNNYPVSSNPIYLEFKLYELILMIGTHMAKYRNPSLVPKLFQYNYLINEISVSKDFKVKITNIRNDFDSEELTKISELLGVGFSILVIEKLFSTNSTNIYKIKGSGLRSDFGGITNNNETIGFEAKGASSKKVFSKAKIKSIQQKATSRAQIKVGVCSFFKENVISEIEIIDPPGGNEQFDLKEMHFQRALNISSLFNFLGHAELSNYFLLMSKRISNNDYQKYRNDKELLYTKIHTEYSNIIFQNNTYKGTFVKYDDIYVFTGIRERLVGFQDFISDLSNDETLEYPDEKVILYLGKILIREFSTTEFQRLNISAKNFIEEIKVEDFENSSNVIGRNLIFDLLKQAGFRVSFLNKLIVISFNNSKIYLYYKKNFKNVKNLIIEKENFKNGLGGELLFLTPSIFPKEFKSNFNVIDLSDFEFLIESLKNQVKLRE